MQINVRIEDREVQEGLRQLSQKMQHLRPVMKDIGELVRTSVERNFAAQGRPEAWIPSRRVLKKGGQTLSDKGRLRRSFTVKADDSSATVGTNVVYAAIHQLGGTITQGARSELFLRKRHVRGDKKGQFKKGTTAGQGFTFRGGEIFLPARPFLMVQAEDWPQIGTVIKRYLMQRQS